MKQIPDDLAKILKELQPPSALKDSLLDGKNMKCVCDNVVAVHKLEVFHSGVCTIISNVCKDCKSAKKHDRETARIVCAQCRQVVMRLAPNKDKSGFCYLANHTYHLEQCGVCTPGLKESLLVEKQIYDKQRK